MKLHYSEPAHFHSVEKYNRDDLYIASLDTLSADEYVTLVPSLNEKKDTIALVLMLVDILPSMPTAATFDFYQAGAAMRDIGILLGSLKRHGVEPVNVIPELEDKLNLLGHITHLPPRDTLIHYTVWNPAGERHRTYTGTQDEKYLIESVKMAMNPLIQAIFYLKELHTIPLHSPDFVVTCEKVAEHFDAMVKGIVHARRSISPMYFAQELRFYYDPILLNDKMYLGPGAVEMPVFVFDHLLWSANCEDVQYKEFKNTYVPYIQDYVRNTYFDFLHQDSLVTKVSKVLANEPFMAEKLTSAKALIRLFNLLKSFRMPHKKLADEAYAQSAQKEEEHRKKGSGGYEPEILQHILKLNLHYLTQLEENILQYSLHQPPIEN
jgi:hypothetical protein